MNTSLKRLNLIIGIIILIFAILLAYFTATTVTNMRSGSAAVSASPKTFPFLISFLLVVAAIFLIYDSLMKGKLLSQINVELYVQGESLKFLKYLGLIVLIPILVPFLGFYQITSVMLCLIMFFSGVRKPVWYIIGLAIIFSLSYGVIQTLSGVRLPSGSFYRLF